MVFPERKVTLKDGTICVMRSPRVEEAEILLNYLNATCAETEFLLRSPEDPTLTVEEEIEYITHALESENQYNIQAFIGGKMVGSCMLRWADRKRIKHRADIGIAILREFWNKGIGTKFFEIIEELAKQNGIKQLELEYVETNVRGEALYKKRGFHEVGRTPNALLSDSGKYLAEVKMIKEI